MLSWMAHAIVLTVVFGLAAASWEQAAIIRRWFTRCGWVLAGALSLAVPIVQFLWPQSASRQIIEILAEPTRATAWDARVVSMLSGTAPAISDPGLDERWLMWAWLLSSIATAMYFASGYRALRRAHLQSRRAVIAGHPVVLTQNLGPAVIGWLRPKIVMPQWIEQLSTEEQALIVAHEREHLLAHDVRLIGLGSIAVIAFPWNAALWWLFLRLRLAIEFDCDARVLRHNPDAVQYGKVLLHASRVPTARGLVAPALFESRTALERRIKAFLRSGARSDRIVAPVFAAASLAIGVAAANVESPQRVAWSETSVAVDDARLASPQRQFDEQWSSIVKVVKAFEPAALAAPATTTAYVFLVLDSVGRVASHHLELRPSFQQDAISVESEKEILQQHEAKGSETHSMSLQVKLRASARTPDAVVIAIDPAAKALSPHAPRVDLPAIRRDRDWLQASLVRRAQTERSILQAADSAALESGLDAGQELWVVLDSAGRYVNSGRRGIIADPNASRSFVQAYDRTYRVVDVVRGTSVRDRAGERIRVTWHWLAAEDY